MATADLSKEEFSRLQQQLIELRTNNYQLLEKSGKLEQEVQGLRTKVAGQDRAQNVKKKISGVLPLGKNRDKMQKDLAATAEENNQLFRKLEQMEEQHRLQTQELMEELSKVHAEKDAADKEKESLRAMLQSKGEPSSVGDGASTRSGLFEDSDLVRRLKAENAALEKTLAASSGRNPHALVSGVDVWKADLEVALTEPLDGLLKELRASSKDEDDGETDGVSGIVPLVWEGTKNAVLARLLDNVVTCLSKIYPTSPATDNEEEISTLQLRLATEQEETELLKKQLEQSKSRHEAVVTDLETKLIKSQENVQKKQQCIEQLQGDKDSLFQQQQVSKEKEESDIERLMEQTSRVHTELAEANQTVLEQQKTIAGLRDELGFVQSQAQACTEGSTILVDSLREEISNLQAQVNSQGKTAGSADPSDTKHKELLGTLQQREKQIEQLQQEKVQSAQALMDANKTADKRKQMVDALAIEKQQLADDWRQRLGELEAEHMREREETKREIADLQVKVQRVAELEEELQSSADLRKRAVNAEEQSSQLTETLKENESQFREHLEELRSSLTKQLSDANAENEAALSALHAEVERAVEEKRQLEQTLADTEAKIRISEKKANSMMKDTRHQLQLERNRADRLQQQVSELEANYVAAPVPESGMVSPEGSLTDVTKKSRKNFEDLFSPLTSSDSGVGLVKKLRTISGPSFLHNEESTSSRGSSVATSPPPTVATQSLASQESDDVSQALVARLRQENTELAERVHHLEENAAAMAEDVIEKAAIIKSHVMGDSPVPQQKLPSRTGSKMLFKKFLGSDSPSRDRRDSNDTTAKEVQQLQRRVEEGIIKNTHLQQNVEALTGEVARLQSEKRALEEQLK